MILFTQFDNLNDFNLLQAQLDIRVLACDVIRTGRDPIEDFLNFFLHFAACVTVTPLARMRTAPLDGVAVFRLQPQAMELCQL